MLVIPLLAASRVGPASGLIDTMIPQGRLLAAATEPYEGNPFDAKAWQVEWPQAIMPKGWGHRWNTSRPAHGMVGARHFKAWFTAAFAVALVSCGVFRRWQDKLIGTTEELDPLQPSQGDRFPTGRGDPAAELLELSKSCVLVVVWMVCSMTLVMFNKWLFSRGNFPYPLTLAALHMACCFVVFGAASWLPVGLRRRIMPDIDKVVAWGPFLQGSLPIAVLYAVGVGFGDLGFLYASVSFNLFIKPTSVIFTSIAAFLFKIEVCTSTHIFIAFLIAVGVAVASATGLEFSFPGLIFQLVAVSTEGARLVVIQTTTQHGMKLDPVTTLYRFAPFTGLLLCCLAFIFDEPVNWGNLTSPGLLAVNCAIAVVLNVLIVAAIARTSAMVFVMCGVLKDVATIAISAAAFQVHITGLEIIGYGLSLFGICLFKVYKSNIQVFLELGFFGGFQSVLLHLFGKEAVLRESA